MLRKVCETYTSILEHPQNAEDLDTLTTHFRATHHGLAYSVTQAANSTYTTF
jgi:hypothetical protein